jgi:hypothetical protein
MSQKNPETVFWASVLDCCRGGGEYGNVPLDNFGV